MIAEILTVGVMAIMMLIIGLPLLHWLENRHSRKLDEKYRKRKEMIEGDPIDWSKVRKNRERAEKLDKDDEK